MTTSYPNSKQTFTDPTSSNTLNSPSHSGLHTDMNDTVEAIQDKIGTGASTPASGKVLAGTGAGTSEWKDQVVKAAGSDITTGTDDAKFLTSKALADATVGKLGAAWTNYTPTPTSGTGSFTTVSASGYWTQIGKTVHFIVTVTITTNGTAATSVVVPLPTNAARAAGRFFGGEKAAVGFPVAGYMSAVGAITLVKMSDNSYPGGNGYAIEINGTYEAA